MMMHGQVALFLDNKKIGGRKGEWYGLGIWFILLRSHENKVFEQHCKNKLNSPGEAVNMLILFGELGKWGANFALLNCFEKLTLSFRDDLL